MSTTLYKYNPAFLSDEELLDIFFLRRKDSRLILETIDGNASSINQHVLIVGPRGMGKTTLVLRIAAEIRANAELSKKWYPLAFAEESYPVTTTGEFWLEALCHLARQTGDTRWQRAYAELRIERDDVRLRERALAQLLDFADMQQQRLVLIVENLQMLFGEQLKSEDAWAIRHTLQNESRIMMLATATSRFESIGNVNEAMYEQFQIIDLKPLDNDICGAFWSAKTGITLDGRCIRPIQILTGGNPRLLAIIADFAARSSFGELMNNLTKLVDDHTDYFKSHLDNLPLKERKVFVALAEIWDPATARDVAREARVDVNIASADLSRLVNRGAVVVTEERSRMKKYQLAERMYNIYYLMRRRSDPASRMHALVSFMHSFYQPTELAVTINKIVQEIITLAPESRHDHIICLKELIRETPKLELQRQLFESVKPQLEKAGIAFDYQETQRSKSEVILIDNLQQKYDSETNDVSSAENTYRRDLELQPDSSENWFRLARLLADKPGRYVEAENAYLHAFELDKCDARVVHLLLDLFGGTLKRPQDCLSIADLFFQHAGRQSEILNSLAWGLFKSAQLSYLPQAEDLAREASEKDPVNVNITHTYATILVAQGKFSETIELLPQIVNDVHQIENFSTDFIDLLVSIAAAGRSAQALAILRESPSARLMEPLVCALQVMNGEEVSVAQEIKEVATDIVEAINERRTGMHIDGEIVSE